MTSPLDPFFLDVAAGRRFCLHYPPQARPAGALLYIHPFAEELNKSRRMVAEMARRMARHGFAVLQIDLAGCGDSSGDFADASWQLWLDDVAAAAAWLKQRYSPLPLTLWGLRTGALLAAQHAAADAAWRRLLLWSPVVNGEQFLTQFLRLRLASQMLAAEQGGAGGTQQLLQQLRSGTAIEVAGYVLAPGLALPLGEARLAVQMRPQQHVDWFELAGSAERPVAPVVEKLIGDWRRVGSDVALTRVVGEAFWSTQEIADVPALWDATLQSLVASHAL